MTSIFNPPFPWMEIVNNHEGSLDSLVRFLKIVRSLVILGGITRTWWGGGNYIEMSWGILCVVPTQDVLTPEMANRVGSEVVV